jgi:hypothetical protein
MNLSDARGTLSVVVRYDIAALLSRFDVKVKGGGDLTGKLSSFLGERLLLSVLIRYLSDVEGHAVGVLGGRPSRDGGEFVAGHNGVRDLDAWLLLDGGQLAAVECKHLTSSSTDRVFRSVPVDGEAQASYARNVWGWLGEWFAEQDFNQYSKIALPLKPPKGKLSLDTADARRILAVWTPVAEDGRSCMSRLPTSTLRSGKWTDIEVEVFSASLYLRGLLADGVTHLEAGDEDLGKVLAALNAVVEVTEVSTAG